MEIYVKVFIYLFISVCVSALKFTRKIFENFEMLKNLVHVLKISDKEINYSLVNKCTLKISQRLNENLTFNEKLFHYIAQNSLYS